MVLLSNYAKQFVVCRVVGLQGAQLVDFRLFPAHNRQLVMIVQACDLTGKSRMNYLCVRSIHY